MLTVRFWGVRGSIPCPGHDTVIYGGNTSCLEIRADDRLIIIDLGSGVHPLGEWLLENDLKKYGKIKAEIFITHTHWDHIMGLPMFNPIYTPGVELRITGPAAGSNDNIKTIIENQFSSQYWPVQTNELAAKIEYNQISCNTADLGGGLTVTGILLNHQVTCLGYKIGYNGKSIVTVYDHEPFQSEEDNEKIKQFIKGADIVIHDAQYTQEEYLTHIGWGHSSYNHVIQAASGMGIKKLVLFHHDPSHTDSQLEQIEKSFAGNIQPLIIMAKEGLILEA
ncbi:MAG: MBL fold metallo-hydrolase [Treponema sp.]|nr:MBL fold metallo-hydrolase [Treponema sp.]